MVACLFFWPGHGANSSMQPASPSPDLVRTASTRQDMERPDLARPVSPYERKNSIPIRLCRTSDPAQPLPICPARATPIPKVLKALQKARDQSRQRRQIPMDMAVTNYSWKSKFSVTQSTQGPLPPHIGQTCLDRLESKHQKSNKPKASICEGNNEEMPDINQHQQQDDKPKKKKPPEIIRHMGYVMRYNPRLQPRRWKSDIYIGNVSPENKMKCLLASSELAFKKIAPWLEVIENDPHLGQGSPSVSYEPSRDYEWITTEFANTQQKSIYSEGIGRKDFTIKGIMNGAVEGHIDLRRDGEVDYTGAIDDMGNRTRAAELGVDRLVGKKQYRSKRFNGVNDMGLRLWALENGYELKEDEIYEDPSSSKQRANTGQDYWPVDDQNVALPFWPPQRLPCFDRSERKDLDKYFSGCPDVAVNARTKAISFDQRLEERGQAVVDKGKDTNIYKKNDSAAHLMSKARDKTLRSYGNQDIIDVPHHDPPTRMQKAATPTSLEPLVEAKEEEEEQKLHSQVEQTRDSEQIAGPAGVVYKPSEIISFPLSNEYKPGSIHELKISVDWWEHFDEDEDENGQNEAAAKAFETPVPEPELRRARASIHIETLLPDEQHSESMPESFAGRKRNRSLSLIFVEEIESLEEELGFCHDRHVEKEKALSHIYRYWARMGRILPSMVMTCPETMRVHMVRYNLHSTLQQYKFDGLVAALDSVQGGQELFFNSTLPHIIARALKLSEILRSSQGIIPTMRKDSRSKFVIPRYQVAAILCNMLLCALPNNDVSFAELLISNQGFQIAKVCSFLNYFRRISQLPLDEPKGNLTFVRTAVAGQFVWRNSNYTLSPLRVHTEALVYDSYASTHLQTVASGKHVGSGMFYRRCTPEETHICNYPELGVALIVNPPLDDLEALHIRGAERFNRTENDGLNVKFAGDFVDTTPEDEHGNFNTSFVAMDANRFEDYKDHAVSKQISRDLMQRDLDKALTAFTEPKELNHGSLKSISVGAWGQGAPFRGVQEVKVLLMWMAASQNEKEIDFYSKGVLEEDEVENLRLLATAAAKHEYSVSEIYTALAELSATHLSHAQLFPYLIEFLERNSHLEGRGGGGRGSDEEDDEEDE